MSEHHRYIPATDSDEKVMLDAIGVSSFDELVKIIPDSIRFKGELGIGASLSEIELAAEMGRIAAKNNPAASGSCFIGGGVYDHYTPEAVKAVAMRSEFYTAYTPYQAEVSQGTLQVMYEFQSMITAISGLDIANASLYDGASAVAEACIMAVSATGRSKVLIPETTCQHTCKVVETYLQNRDTEIVKVAAKNGRIDMDDLAAKSVDAACVVVQSPNVLGLVEDWKEARKVLADGTLLVAFADPLALGLLESPGACGADIYVGEGQSLGIPVSFGGPYLGLMAATSDFKRRLPGRIIGRTVDKDGETGFVMVLRTREQDIRREKATSNICTNQGLLALWSTIYMSLLGKSGLQRISRLCFDSSQYLARSIEALPNCEIPFGYGFVKEFIVKTRNPAHDIRQAAEAEGLFVGTIDWQGTNYLQIAVTEKRTITEMDNLVEFLRGAA